ncbi:reverse transcriptase domain-containing protein [Cardinium endosymbiont of Oedothorax gibbosus]|uniref:reverse transcriptase domain-containing protein n=1 Tax=Cardinium endosymbiont of Oedothorax gibbosus TaxID=931101 RepID=UPI0020259581|nr:reverse transcriptase domain-containing protein [Cardinium endosymbiont of Oedothorax gibbosus]
MSDCPKAMNGTLKVQQLQRTLYLKSKQCKEVRFYSIYDKIYLKDVLWEAWRQVKANQGSAGIDGKSISDIIDQGEAKIINKLQQQLRAKLYKFTSSRLVEIPKAKGGTRPLEVMTVEDLIVLTAMKIVIEPIFEADFHECSYGYRPKRGAKQASLVIREDLYQQAWGVVEIDFQSYFTSIPHEKLLKLINVSSGFILLIYNNLISII